MSLVAIWTVRSSFVQAASIAVALGHGAHEIAAEPDEGLHLARQDAFAGLDRVHALLARRLEAVLLRQLVERHQFGLLGDADGALALDVGMAAHRRDAGAGAADIALAAAAG